jgi:hypothetical protein
MSDLVPVIASSEEEVNNLKLTRTDTIVFQENDHEVCVYTSNPLVWEHIRTGNAWHMGFVDVQADGYRMYVYTRLSLTQVTEHLIDPTQHQGRDE